MKTNSNLASVEVILADGTRYTTEVNASQTDAQISSYFVGHYFNTDSDTSRSQCVTIEIRRTVKIPTLRAQAYAANLLKWEPKIHGDAASIAAGFDAANADLYEAANGALALLQQIVHQTNDPVVRELARDAAAPLYNVLNR